MSTERGATKKLEPLVSFGKSFKLIPEDKVPLKLRRASQEWLKVLQSIPKGQAMETTENELGMRGTSMKIMVARLKKSGLLSGNYYVTQRTTDGNRTVYVVHATRPVE